MESGESREPPKPNNKASVTSPNTTNPPQSSPTDQQKQQASVTSPNTTNPPQSSPTDHQQQQQLLIISSTSASTDDHDISSPKTLLPSPAEAEAEEHAGGGVVIDWRSEFERDFLDDLSEFERDFLDDLPPGYRFRPTDEELVVEYLMPEIAENRKYPSRIHKVNIFDYHPRQLAEKYRECRENQWYFFTPRKKKYFNGSRPDRSAGGGYWKATGADRKVYSNGVQVGARMSLVFQEGKHPKGVKTNWMMHEFTANTPPGNTKEENQSNDMVLDRCVLCRIYNKECKNGKDPPVEEEGTETIPPNEVEVEVGEEEDDNIMDGIINNQEMFDQGMMNYNSDYIIPPIPQSMVQPNPNPDPNPIHHLHDPPKPFSPNSFDPNPNPIHHLHDPPKPFSPNSFDPNPNPIHHLHDPPKLFSPNTFNPNPNPIHHLHDPSKPFSPNSFSPNPNPIHHLHDPPKAFSPNSFNPNPIHQLHDPPKPFYPNSFDPNSNHYSNIISSSSHHQVLYPPSDLHFSTHDLFPDPLASSSHQLHEPPLYPNSHVYSNSSDPYYFNPDHSCYTGGLVTNDATLSSMNNLGNFSSTSSYLHAYADLENFASPSLDPARANSYSNDVRPGDSIGNPDPCDYSSGDYIGNPDPCDFSSGLSPLASYDSHQITEYSISNYPHSHQDHHAGVSGSGESQTNPDQLTHWDQFKGDQQTHPHQ